MTNKQNTYNRNPITWIKDFWFLAKPYWQSPDRFRAFGLIIVAISFNLLTVGVTVMINKWYNSFYDAIQQYDKVKFYELIIRFCILAFCAIAFSVLSYYFRKILTIRWRKWLTNYYLTNWFQAKAYYKTKFVSQISDNPDQRIQEDINGFITLALDLSLGLISSIVTLLSFIFILWKLSGALKFDIANYHIIIPGYMVWTALIYAVIGTYITFKIGRPLIKLDYQQQAYEADFRFGLMRVREYSESIAFYNGEVQEKSGLVTRFNNVVNNYVAIIYRQLKIDIFGVGYEQVAIIFPLVVAAPRYFAKAIKLGDLMQIASAFGRVQGALSYFISAYSSLAGWRAVMDRLYGFQMAINEAKQLSGLKIASGTHYLKLSNININLPSGTPLINGINLTLNQGDALLIKGRSGSGKTTLLRTIAGLWHYAEGNISQKPNLHSLFIAQKPYLTIGRLKDAVCYPKIDNLPSDHEMQQLLKIFKLEHLARKLDEHADWTNMLSIGEQQRIAICRILINKPDVIYLDEATSALDEEMEAITYDAIKSNLPNSVIVSVGHRSTITKWHDQILDFNNLVV